MVRLEVAYGLTRYKRHQKLIVIPAKAGIQNAEDAVSESFYWIPAFAGMTD